MKLKKVFLIIGIIVLSVLGISIFQEFMVNHTYYKDMLGSRANRELVIRAIIASLIPLWYIMKSKLFSLKKFFIWMLPAALLIFGVAFVMIK